MKCSYPTIKFNNGLDFPIVGLGTWKSKGGAVKQAVLDAIDIGYRHIDTAVIYGNEQEVGDALKEKFADGTVKREEIFVTSKVWNTYHSKEMVPKSVDLSLKNLSLDYLDLYLIHWPFGYEEGGELFPRNPDGKIRYSDVDFVETYKAMEEEVKKGRVKSIGISNFNRAQIERILANCTIKPVNLQVEIHPYLPQVKLFDFCKSHGITVTGYSPLGSPDRPWAKEGEPTLMEDPRLLAIADKYKKSRAQVLIRYQLQRGIVCIPKSVTKSRIQENFQVWDFELAPEDVATLTSMGCNERYGHSSWTSDHKYFPFNAEY